MKIEGDDDTAEVIAAIQSLLKLDMSSCSGIKSKFLESITKLNLQELDLRNSINDQSTQYGGILKKFANLKKLRLNPLLVESDFEGIGDLFLTELSIGGRALIEYSLNFLPRLQKLEKLHLEGHVNDEHIELLSKMVSLQQVSIEGGNFTKKSIPFFLQMKHFQIISIDSYADAQSFQDLRDTLKQLPNVISLNLKNWEEEQNKGSIWM